ncbi:DUF2085 domain-containing protein [Ruminococcus sp.]|uniref:DUF2085 domain-containing protein n=1 Tax=Ruminococcus sp. TaxID=41978 RepID=UPI0025E2A9A0|nr:DUF2085 domain-containing protein [Ruminococcus sp.]MBQ8964984.1 DUF2085 domain-containing protein [Ruminococcus sp.]
MTEARRQQLWVSAMDLGGRCGCHQRADRSFFIRGWQFPVCARCTGVLIGHIIAFPPGLKFSFSPWAAVCGCEVMLADWTLQRLGIKESTNSRRLVTGIIGGGCTALLYAYALKKLLRLVKVRPRT